LELYEDALIAAKRAICLKCGSPEAWSNKINSLIKLRRHEEAKIAIRKAEKLKRKHK
jgi:Flp pilus assembly protein TadD